MNRRLAVFLFLTAVSVAACGGGGSTSAGGGNPPPAPTPTPASTGAGNIPASETIAGAPGWADPTSNRTLYFLSVDTATGATCTAGCLGLWPPDKPSANAAGTENMTIITRSDATGQQWSYQGHPLYTYAGDNGPDQANGEGVPDFGGTWHVARPSAATATTPPGGGTPCQGVYC